MKTKSSLILLSTRGIHPLTIPSDINDVYVEIAGACGHRKLTSLNYSMMSSVQQHQNREIVRIHIPIISSKKYEVFIGGEYDSKATNGTGNRNRGDLSSGIRLVSKRATPVAIAYERAGVCQSVCPNSLDASLPQCSYGYVMIKYSNSQFELSGESNHYRRRNSLPFPISFPSMVPSNFSSSAFNSEFLSINIYRYFVIFAVLEAKYNHLAGFYDE